MRPSAAPVATLTPAPAPTPTETPFVGSADAQRYLRGTQTTQQYTKTASFDLRAAIAMVTGEWLKKLRPPDDVLAKTKWIIRKPRTLTSPASITYVISQRKFPLFDICVGWQVVEHALNANPLSPSKPEQGWVIDGCHTRDFQPFVAPSPWPSASLR